MDDTIRVIDSAVSAHLAKVYAQMKGLIEQYPGHRRRESQHGCREVDLFESSPRFHEEGHDGQSDIKLCLHEDPMLGQELDRRDRRRCRQPYILLDLTRTAITVNGPARSIETYQITISWTVAWAHLAHKNLSLGITRRTTTKTQGLPTATTRRYKWSEGEVVDTIEMVTLAELVEATDEINAILSVHIPS